MKKRIKSIALLMILLFATATNAHASVTCCEKDGFNTYYKYDTHSSVKIPGSRLNCEISVWEKATCIGCGAVKSRTLIERYHHEHVR